MEKEPKTASRLRSLILQAVPKLKSRDKAEQIPRMLEIIQLISQQQQQFESNRDVNDPTDQLVPSRSFRPIRKSKNLRLEGGQQDAFLHELSPFDFKQTQKKQLKEYSEIRSWFFDSEQYMNWLRFKPWQLCLYGHRGCGKTTFAAAVARDLQERFLRSGGAVVVLFLAPKQAVSKQRSLHHDEPRPVDVLLRTVLRQLIESKLQQGLSSSVLEKLRASRTGTIDSSLPAIRSYILEEIAGFNGTFFVVDGVEQCPPAFQVSVTEELLGLSGARVGILITQSSSKPGKIINIRCNQTECARSNVVLYWRCAVCNEGDYHLCQLCYDRDYHCLVEAHKMEEPYTVVEVPLKTTESNILGFFQRKLEREMDINPSLKKKLKNAQQVIRAMENTIAARASGLSIVVNIYIDYLSRKQSFEEILDKLDHLPQTEADYFRDLLKKVLKQEDENDQYLGLCALALARTASYEVDRSLTFDEIAGALEQLYLIQGKESPSLTPDKLLRVTGGLLTISGERSMEIRPFHDHVKIFLYEDCNEEFLEVGLDMAHLCLTSLMESSEFLSGLRGTPHNNAEAFVGRPFLRYAMQCWGYHLVNSKSKRAQDAALRFLQEFWVSPSVLTQMAPLVCIFPVQVEPWSLSTGVHLCTWFGLLELLRLLRERDRGVDLNAKDIVTGRTPITIACMRGHVDLVQDLLDAGANATITCNQGATALWEAVQRNHSEIVDHILAETEPAFWNKTYSQFSAQTAFMLAVSQQKSNVWESFVNRSELDVGIQDASGKTALHVAIESGNVACVQWLANHRDFPRLVNLGDLANKRTALMYLIVSTAVAFQAKVDGGDDSQKVEIFKAMLEGGANIDTVDATGCTLLHYAAAQDDAEAGEIMRYLVQTGMSLDKQDEDGRTALHVACAYGKLENVRLLTEAGASRVARDVCGRTPAVYAVLLDQHEEVMAIARSEYTNPGTKERGTFEGFDNKESNSAVWQLVMQEADSFADGTARMSDQAIQEVDPLGCTALHCAIFMSKPHMVAQLLKDGRVDVDAVDVAGCTALHLLTDRLNLNVPDDNFEEMVDLLLQHSASVGLKDYCGNSALDTAIDKAFEPKGWRIVARLFMHDPDVCLSKDRLQKLFSQSCRQEGALVIDKLLDAGANVLLRDKSADGLLPSQIASDRNSPAEVVSILREAENDACLGRGIVAV
ncbi:MAG: hypothetical protein M1821_007168 [Bathelium mastoideum]|nr:MAG: hypothetical protein M1821_007168 [Bathelium mastoideum]